MPRQLSIAIAVSMAVALGTATPSSAADPVEAGDDATQAEAPTPQQQRDLLARVKAKYEGVEVMQAQFQQTTTSALYGESSQSGKLTLKRPKQMRWEFAGDGKQFITDGSTMWIYSAADNQVIVYDDFGAAGGLAADQLLQSLDKLETLFEVDLLSSGDHGHRLALAPLDEASKQQVKRIELVLDQELAVDKVEVTDAYDGVTTLDFSEVTTGGQIDPSMFTFTPPEGVEVVDASG